MLTKTSKYTMWIKITAKLLKAIHKKILIKKPNQISFTNFSTYKK